MRWSHLSIPGAELADARLQCHHAAQLNTRLARGFVPAQADDSHTSLMWNHSAQALTGEPVGPFRLGLRIADLTFVLLGTTGTILDLFPLDGRTQAEASEWLAAHLRSAGLDPAPLMKPIHFELEDHPLLHGGRFQLRGSEYRFEELSRWYGNAEFCLSSIPPPVRCWPHHFDIAAQIAVGDGSIGVGLSPGDANYGQPYFYVTPWPYPKADLLPRLTSGNWHTEGWVGAVLTADEIVPEADQYRHVRNFLDAGIAALTKLQESSE